MLILLATFGFLALMAGSAALNGWVLSVLWRWFVMPTFGVAAISIPAAIGLSMVIHYITYQPVHDPRDTREKLIEALVFLFFKPAIALSFGYVVHRFFM